MKYDGRPETEDPYSIPNKGPVPQLDAEEGLPPGTLDIAWVEPWRKNLYHWSVGLKWYERLHAHATMNSARRNAKCKRPFEPKDELDLVLSAAYCPMLDPFAEKTDPYLQIETALGEEMNIEFHKYRSSKTKDYHPKDTFRVKKVNLRRPAYEKPEPELKDSWRTLRNRIVIYPDRSIPRAHPIRYTNGGVQRRENIYNVKLGIAADHSPQTNGGYSRTPCGAFYSI